MDKNSNKDKISENRLIFCLAYGILMILNAAVYSMGKISFFIPKKIYFPKIQPCFIYGQKESAYEKNSRDRL